MVVKEIEAEKKHLFNLLHDHFTNKTNEQVTCMHVNKPPHKLQINVKMLTLSKSFG